MAAAGKGRLADAQALLASGADPLARARDGSTAADWAARFGHANTAAALREHAKVHPWQVIWNTFQTVSV